MEAGQLGWLLWWPTNKSYYLRCDECKEGNRRWWRQNDAQVFVVYYGDIGLYRAECGCGKLLKDGITDFFPQYYYGMPGLPEPNEFLQGTLNLGRR